MSSIELGSSVIDALVGMGVTDVVLAPGSRSASLALAVERADRDARLRLHVRIDERVAAFTALGLAKATGRAAAVITTSGTAVANLVPAAMEATTAGIPLLLTADRPSQHVGTGASQTGEQVGLFGASVLGVIRLSSESGDPSAWAAGVHRGVALAEGRRTRQPGAVQLNLEFAEPMVAELPPPVRRPLTIARPVARESLELDGRRTVILAGDAAPAVGAEARALAELSGAPLLAEPTSNARTGGNAVASYRHALIELADRIERVIVFGHPTLSRPVAALLRRADIELVIVTDRATWIDPGHRASLIADRVCLERQDPQWLRQWLDFPWREPREGFGQRRVADAVLAGLGPDDDLMYGSSSIIRAADVSPIAERAPHTWANRGLAGIDGTIATATGIALANGRPMTVLLGDLTAQHDLGALVRPPSEPWPELLRVVVLDDQGGSIFRTLEQGAPAYAHAFDRVFLTPQGADLAAVAVALGWRAVTVTDETGLREALACNAEFILARL